MSKDGTKTEDQTANKETNIRNIKKYIIGSSSEIDSVRREIIRLAPTDEPILIIGETGTGKELVAKAIHESGLRAGKKYLTLHCGVLEDKNTAESELFGHKKGSFTGAQSDRPGAFLTANRGTLFLDEFDSINRDIQVMLLRAIDNGEIKKKGDEMLQKVDVRVIMTSMTDLREKVKDGSFRKDLFYRIDTPIRIPPLRERPKDIPALIKYCVKQNFPNLEKSEQHTLLHIFKEEEQKMQNYTWEGNVRQLNSFIKNAVNLWINNEPIDFNLPDQESDKGLPDINECELVLMDILKVYFNFSWLGSDKFKYIFNLWLQLIGSENGGIEKKWKELKSLTGGRIGVSRRDYCSALGVDSGYIKILERECERLLTHDRMIKREWGEDHEKMKVLFKNVTFEEIAQNLDLTNEKLEISNRIKITYDFDRKLNKILSENLSITNNILRDYYFDWKSSLKDLYDNIQRFQESDDLNVGEKRLFWENQDSFHEKSKEFESFLYMLFPSDFN